MLEFRSEKKRIVVTKRSLVSVLKRVKFEQGTALLKKCKPW